MLTDGDLLYRYDPAAFDVWSCGVILFFMLAAEQLHITDRAGRCELMTALLLALNSKLL